MTKSLKAHGVRTAKLGFFSGASMAALLLSSNAAQAQCAPNPTQSGQPTLCSGTEVNGLNVIGGAQVNLEADAAIEAPNVSSSAISIRENSAEYYADAYLALNGVVRGGSAGVLVDGASALYRLAPTITVGANGSISGEAGIKVTGNPMNQFYPRTVAVVYNSGSIAGSGGYALLSTDPTLVGFQSVANYSNGTIGAISANISELTNYGVIEGGVNSAYKFVGSSNFYSSTVRNYGQISSSSSLATLLLDGKNPSSHYSVSLYNSGYISNDMGRSIQSSVSMNIINRGTITGDVDGSLFTFAGVSGHSIDNRKGVINGGVSLGAGNDILIVDYGGAGNLISGISGSVDAGAGNDQLVLNFDSDTSLDALLVPPTSFETLALSLPYDVTLTLERGFSAPNGLYFVNSGYPEGGADPSGTVVNNADLVTNGAAIGAAYFGNAPSLINNGTITANLAGDPIGYAVTTGWMSDFINNSAIIAHGGGGASLSGGNFNNAGSILADNTALLMFNGLLSTTGTIRSANGIGLVVSGSSGTVAVNSGLIEGFEVGASTTAQLENSGIITSANIGVQLGFYGILINRAGGVITGGSEGVSAGPNSVGRAIIDNAGIINGNVSFGAQPAYWDTGNRFIARPGGVVNGNLHLISGSTLVTGLTASGPLGGVTGSITGEGDLSLQYLVSTDIAVEANSFGIFNRVVYDLNNVTLDLNITATDSALGFAGKGTVNFSGAIVYDGNDPTAYAVDLNHSSEHMVAIEGSSEQNHLDTAITLVNDGSIEVDVQNANWWDQGAVSVGQSGKFLNIGEVVARNNSPNNIEVVAVNLLGNLNNSGSILLDGAIGVRGSAYNSFLTSYVVNSGKITEISGGAPSRGLVGVRDLNNSGIIRTTDAAASIDMGAKITNSGTIESTSGIAIDGNYNNYYYGSTSVFIENEQDGTISGRVDAIKLGSGYVENAGIINGNIQFQSGFSVSSFVRNSGSIYGNVSFGDADDLFVLHQGGDIRGVVDGGAGQDTFARGFTDGATFDLAAGFAGVSNFERLGVGAYGTDTIVTLTNSLGEHSGRLTLLGDGTVINQVDVAATLGQDSFNSTLRPNAVQLGFVAPYFGAYGASRYVEADFAFVNQGTLGDGVSGGVRSFENSGTVGNAAHNGNVVALEVSAGDFTFVNSGLIDTTLMGGDLSNENGWVGPSFEPAVTITSSGFYSPPVGIVSIISDKVTIDNSGVINGGIKSVLNARDVSFLNTGEIYERTYKVNESNVGATRAVDINTSSSGLGTDTLEFVNSGVLVGDTSIFGAIANVQVTNSGHANDYIIQTLRVWTKNGRVDQAQVNFDNSGTVDGAILWEGQALATQFTNSGSISVSDDDTYAHSAVTITSDTLAANTVNVANSGTISAGGIVGMSGLVVRSNVEADGNVGGGGVIVSPPVHPPIPLPASPLSASLAVPISLALDAHDGAFSTIHVVNSGAILADGGAQYVSEYQDYWSSYPAHISPIAGVALMAKGTVPSHATLVNSEAGVISAIGPMLVADGDAAELPMGMEYMGSIAVFGSASYVDILNDGKIIGNVGGQLPAASLVVIDDERILTPSYLAGAILTLNSVDLVRNSVTGVIKGSIDLGGHDDSLENLGQIDGDIFLGAGNDRLIHALTGSISGIADGGDGLDGLLIDITGGGAIDLARFINFEDVRFTGVGDVKLTGALALDTVALADGALTLGVGQILQTTGSNAITGTQDGAESVTNRGLIFGNLSLLGQNDIFDNQGSLTGFTDLGDGDDQFYNSGAIGGPVYLGAGDDLATLFAGSTIPMGLFAGAGRDTLNLAWGGTYAAPIELSLPGVTGFEVLQLLSGTTVLSQQFSMDQINVLGGYLFGRAGSLLTANGIYVAPGAVFGSAGTVASNVTVAGTLSPGASPGTMTVEGNVALLSGSNTLFELTPTITDQLLISGSLDIASGATLTLAGDRPLTPGSTLDLIVADGGINGSFTTITKPSTVLGFVAQRGNHIQLLGQFQTAAGFTAQQANTVAYVNNVLVAGEANSALLDALSNLLDSSGGTNGEAFKRLSAEAYASASQIGVENGLSIAQAMRSGLVGQSREEAGMFTFAQGLGDWRKLSGSKAAGISRANTHSYGVLGGVGFGSQEASVGAFIGYLDGRQTIKPLGARTDADGIVLGISARYAVDGLEATATLGYSDAKAETQRALPGSATAKSHYHIRSVVADIAIGYSAPISGDWDVMPKFGLTHISAKRRGAEETGSAAFGLLVEGKRDSATFADISLNLVRGRDNDAAFQPHVGAGLRGQLNNRLYHTATAGFAGADTRFVSYGASRRDVLFTANAGFTYRIGQNASLYANYEGEFGNGGAGSNANIGIRVGF